MTNSSAQRRAHPDLLHDGIILALAVQSQGGHLSLSTIDTRQQAPQIVSGDIAPGLVVDLLVHGHHPRRPGAALGKPGAEQKSR